MRPAKNQAVGEQADMHANSIGKDVTGWKFTSVVFTTAGSGFFAVDNPTYAGAFGVVAVIAGLVLLYDVISAIIRGTTHGLLRLVWFVPVCAIAAYCAFLYARSYADTIALLQGLNPFRPPAATVVLPTPPPVPTPTPQEIAGAQAAEDRRRALAAEQKKKADDEARAAEATRAEAAEALRRIQQERLQLEEAQRRNAAQAEAAQAAEAQRRKAAEDEARRQAVHPAAVIAGTWIGWIGPPYANRDDAFRTFEVTLRSDGSISCLWYWKAQRDPTKRCVFSQNTVYLVTAADSVVQLTLSGNTLQGSFRLAAGEVSPVTMRRAQ